MIIYDNQLIKVKKNINAYIKIALYQNNIKKQCPYCNSKRIIRYGKYKGIQRYLCKNDECKKTFSNTTNSVCYRSKKTSIDWIKYIEMMFERKTLKECSEELNMNIATAFYWRHKVLKVLMKAQENTVLKDYVYMRKMPIKESFKGDRHIEKIKRDNIYYVVAADRKGQIIGSPICRNRWDGKRMGMEIFSKLDIKTEIFMSTDRYLVNETKALGKEPIYAEEEDKRILNTFYNDVIRTLQGFYGVATKYFKGYLYWISLFFIPEKMDNISIFNKLFKINGYICNRKIKELSVGV